MTTDPSDRSVYARACLWAALAVLLFALPVSMQQAPEHAAARGRTAVGAYVSAPVVTEQVGARAPARPGRTAAPEGEVPARDDGRADLLASRTRLGLQAGGW